MYPVRTQKDYEIRSTVEANNSVQPLAKVRKLSGYRMNPVRTQKNYEIRSTVEANNSVQTLAKVRKLSGF